MQDIIGQICGYLWGVWRYRWWMLIVAWIIALAGWAWVAQMPEKYEATARLQVDTNTVLRPLLRGLTVAPDIDRRIALMSRTILSRPNLEKLMRMADLDLQARTERQKEQIISNLQKNIRLSGSRRNASLYSVSYVHRDRETAKRVVQSLVTIFIETALGGKREDSRGAQGFLDRQIAEYENRLAQAEQRLATFKQEHVDVLPGSQGGYYQKLGALRDRLGDARLQLSELENRRDEIKRQLGGEEPVFLSSGSAGSQAPAVSLLENRIQSQKLELDDLSYQYTDKHPKVVQIKRLIKNLEQEKRQAMQEASSFEQGDYSGLQSSPLYQQMRTMLAETEARIAELKVRVREYQSRVRELEEKVNSIPEIEAELKQLDRDYSVVQQQYNSLLQRRESAQISEDVEQDTGGASFQIVDPPYVPSQPSEPDKVMLNSLVLVASFGIGGALAVLMSLLKPVIIDRWSLARHTALPVLGSVSYVPSPSEKRTGLVKNIQFATLMLGLLLVYAGLNMGGGQWV